MNRREFLQAGVFLLFSPKVAAPILLNDAVPEDLFPSTKQDLTPDYRNILVYQDNQFVGYATKITFNREVETAYHDGNISNLPGPISASLTYISSKLYPLSMEKQKIRVVYTDDTDWLGQGFVTSVTQIEKNLYQYNYELTSLDEYNKH